MSAVPCSTAQHNMIEQQIRPWNVFDSQVLDLMHRLPREPFMPEKYKQLAYADIPAPLNSEQNMLEPRVAARVLQALDIKATDNILEIGTGSGYLTACMASLGNHVDSWELDETTSDNAASALDASDINNINLSVGNGISEAEDKEYDVIVITGSIPSIPESCKERLTTGGRLLAFVELNPINAVLVTRNENSFSEEILFESDVTPIQNTEANNAFVF